MWWDHMGGYGGWGWGFGWLFMVLFWVLVIAGLVALLRWLFGRESRGFPNDRALEILAERYARGEIDREQYEEMRRDLESR